MNIRVTKIDDGYNLKFKIYLAFFRLSFVVSFKIWILSKSLSSRRDLSKFKMEENSGKERMKILSNITNTSGVEDCEQDDYHYNTNSCSEETEVRSSSASKRNENKENPSLMKRMLRGSRSVKQLPKSSNPPLSPGGDVPDGGRDGRKANNTTNAEPEAMGTGGVRPKSSSSGTKFI